MKAIECLNTLRQIVHGRASRDLVLESSSLLYQSGLYEFSRIATATLNPRFWAIITAVFHGDEPAGTLTVVQRLSEMANLAHSRGVGLIVYPLINPSGFDAGTRYNIDDVGQNHPNNDFCRYVLANGGVVDDLGSGTEFSRWFSARLLTSDARPIETVRLHDCLDADLRNHDIKAAIDLHQDQYLKGPAAYAYAFGDLSRYGEITREVEKLVTVIKNADVSSGQISPAWANHQGLIRRHDGSITDYFHRHGVPHTVALETTTDTPTATAIEVNMIWIRGIIELVAQEK